MSRSATPVARSRRLHPMYGPDTELLSGRHLIFVDAGCPEATAEAKALFSATMVEELDMSLEDHDRLIAYVLGLSHALEHRILYGTRGKWRGCTEAREAVVDDLRCAAARLRRGRTRQPSHVFRDPEPQRLWPGSARCTVSLGCKDSRSRRER